MRTRPTILFFSPDGCPAPALVRQWAAGHAFPLLVFSEADEVESIVLRGHPCLLFVDGDNSGPAGVQMVPKAAWTAEESLRIAVDLNAVPPLGIEGVEVEDAGKERNGVLVYGAFGVGNFKTKLHKECVGRLFTRNDLVLDAEAIADVARELVKKKKR